MPVTVRILTSQLGDPNFANGQWKEVQPGTHQVRVTRSPAHATVSVQVFSKNGPEPFLACDLGSPIQTCTVSNLVIGDTYSITATAWDTTDVDSDRVGKTKAVAFNAATTGAKGKTKMKKKSSVSRTKGRAKK